MEASLNHGAVAPKDRLQWPFYQNKEYNRFTCYYFPQTATNKTTSLIRSIHDDTFENNNEDEEKEEVELRYIKDTYTSNSTPIRGPTLFDEDHISLDNRSELGANFNMLPSKGLQKSNSYSGNMRPKATILKQDSLNGRIATSLTDDEIAINKNTLYPSTSSTSDLMSKMPRTDYDDDAVVDLSDEHDLLMPSTINANGGGIGIAINSSVSASRRNTRGSIKVRSSAFLSRIVLHRKYLLGFILLLLAFMAFLLCAYLTRGYTERFMFWIEMQNPWIIVSVIIPLFVIVSFPIAVGYFVLMLTSGYLFGAIKGIAIIVVGANIGVAVAHWTIRSLRHRIPIHKLIKNETGRAILRVIAGPKAFKVVIFTRLTPIPFGLQNTIFAVSAINPRIYHQASLLGLLPAQIINAYLGSTLRSMQEVLSNHGTAVTGYITFGLELICGICLMLWVVQKARKELADTLLSDISNEGKLKEIDV